jgi:uncharacterized damage-inducible protein DinB
MSQIDDHGRPEPAQNADEVQTLLGFLDYQRATLEWKTRGLDAAGLAATTAASAMTLGGLLKHISWVERYWFAWRLRGGDPGEPWNSIDWDSDPDWDWHSAADDSPEELRELWSRCCEASRADVTAVLSDSGLDALARTTWPDGTSPSLRWILVHMIEEYARHNGHADLLRESIDGETGE